MAQAADRPTHRPGETRKFKPDKLILNSPYTEPQCYWQWNPRDRMFHLEIGRRPAGYVVATPGSDPHNDSGTFVPLPLVNAIRPHVRAWREAGYPGATPITQRLLQHWRDPAERTDRRFFFCQMEAIETLIWLNETEAGRMVSAEVPGDGGGFRRLCAKMATGSGKTIVMSMLIAWQVLNKVTYPDDDRFARHIFIVAPGLTVRNRLAVLKPETPGNYYDEFNVVPPAQRENLRRAVVLIHNWHTLNWESEEQIARRRSVDKRGAKSDEAYAREVLGEMDSARDILVINDEAHHAWRVPAESKLRGVSREEINEATKWVGGLDRIHRARGIYCCYDFSATPFAPSGKKTAEEALFGWVISDFGLSDAIESGLVKTPRVVVRDSSRDNKNYRSRLYHLYRDPEVESDLNRKAEEHEPLPDLLSNAYYLLGMDWRLTFESWRDAGHKVPPVMITVANTTHTAARIKYAFDRGKMNIDELSVPDKTLHIDSKVLQSAEARSEAVDIAAMYNSEDEDEPKLTKQEQAELLRRQVDTVGQINEPGEQIRNIISVGMLSEGWDAKTVTHIMGLRAFTSQLLCEQVVGRGLRRRSYETDPETGFFRAEYVNIFGVPFSFLPHEEGEETTPSPTPPQTLIRALPEKEEFAISWPNVLRIDHSYREQLSVDTAKLKSLVLEVNKIPLVANLAPIIDGQPDMTQIKRIDLEKLAGDARLQTVIFKTARDVFDQMRGQWKGSPEVLLARLVAICAEIVESDAIHIEPAFFAQDPKFRRIIITMSMGKIVHYAWEAIRSENTEALVPVFDRERPIRSTHDMNPWCTSRPCEITERSHISHVVYDSTWEATEAFELERNPHVLAWTKTDRLGFEILYNYKGVVKRYRPDFLIRLTNGITLILEVKGQDDQEQQAKREFLAEWVRAINTHGGFGCWAWDVSHDTADIRGVLEKHAKTQVATLSS